MQRFAKTHPRGGELGEGGLSIQGFSYALVLLTVFFVLGVFYVFIKGSAWEGHLMEWLNIVVRLMHVTFGIAWIGASFYFVFLENALNRTHNVRDELAGNLWAVHGGGFYYLEKYKLAPKEIPRDLHWFKYEAYFTWLTGFSLLFVVYYFNAGAMLIDPRVLDISPLAGVGIGVGSFVAGWLLYDGLCRTPLVRSRWFMVLGFALAVGFAYFYTQVFSARAAYIHFGAMLGTLMVGNVFFTIIPAQKAMVKAATEGTPLDPTLGKNALARSLHNNYFTLPVLFVMVSNHFPSTFSNAYPWAVLAAITLGTAGVKHWLNLREKHQSNAWVLPASAAVLLAVAFVTAPKNRNRRHGCRLPPGSAHEPGKPDFPGPLRAVPLQQAHRRRVQVAAQRRGVRHPRGHRAPERQNHAARGGDQNHAPEQQNQHDGGGTRHHPLLDRTGREEHLAYHKKRHAHLASAQPKHLARRVNKLLS
jgi:uncharacterized membrane protein